LLSEKEFFPDVEVSEPKRLDDRAVTLLSDEVPVPPLTERTDELQPGITLDELPPEGRSMKLEPFVEGLLLLPDGRTESMTGDSLSSLGVSTLVSFVTLKGVVVRSLDAMKSLRLLSK
jgi:hypothetical protein